MAVVSAVASLLLLRSLLLLVFPTFLASLLLLAPYVFAFPAVLADAKVSVGTGNLAVAVTLLLL